MIAKSKKMKLIHIFNSFIDIELTYRQGHIWKVKTSLSFDICKYL